MTEQRLSRRIDFDTTGDCWFEHVLDECQEAILCPDIAGGSRGVALRKRSDQVLAVVQREFEALSTRHQVRRLETSLRETERRCDSLLDSSRDAIAYVHEGMHVRVNQAYLEAFGFAEFDDILGLPILDLIAGTHADDFKGVLRGLSKGQKSRFRLDVIGYAPTGAGGAEEAVVEQKVLGTFRDRETRLSDRFHEIVSEVNRELYRVMS